MARVSILKLRRLGRKNKQVHGLLRFRHFLHPYAGFLSFFATVLTLATFICSDMFWENQKDRVASLETTHNIYLLGENINDLQTTLDSVLHKLHRLEVYNVGETNLAGKIETFIKATQQDLNVTEQRIRDSLATYQLLYTKLTSAKIDPSVISCQTKLNDLHQQSLALDVPKKTMPASAAADFEAQDKTIEQNAADLWKSYSGESKSLASAAQKLEDSFNTEYTNANWLLEFFSNFRYWLYGLSFAIGIIGQFAGLKKDDTP